MRNAVVDQTICLYSTSINILYKTALQAAMSSVVSSTSTVQPVIDRAPHLVPYCRIGDYYCVHVATYENTYARQCPGYEDISPEEAYDYVIELCRNCVAGIPAVDILNHEEFHEVFCYSTTLYSEQEVCDGHRVDQIYCVDCHVKCITYRQLENCEDCSQNPHLYGKLQASWIPLYPPHRQ